MPQASVVFASARVSVLAAKLLTKERVGRMLDAKTPEEAVKALAEFGYGGSREMQTPADYQVLIDEEVQCAHKLLHEITPDQPATDLFLLQYDYHNLKALVKARLQGKNDAPVQPGGSMDVEFLQSKVRERDYRSLPKEMQKALAEVDMLSGGRATPQVIDTIVDAAMYTDILQRLEDSDLRGQRRKTPELETYFRARIDLTNIGTLLRARKANLPKEIFARLLMPQADITREQLLSAYDQPLDALGQLLGKGELRQLVMEGIEDYIATGSTAALERRGDNYLIDLFRAQRHNIFGIQPVIGYVLAREQEARVIRLVMTGKLNNIPAEVIQERLRDLYV